MVERDVDVHGLTVAHDGQRRFVAKSCGAHEAQQRVVVVDRVAIEGHDGVAFLQASLVGRAAGDDRGTSGARLGDGRAAAGHTVGFNRVGLDDHAEGDVLNRAILDDLIGNALDEVRRNREADTNRSGGVGGRCGRGNRGVDADYLAGRVEGRATRVTGVDGRVDLDGVGDDLVIVVVGHGHRAVQGGDDAGGGGVVVAERVADSHHVLADGELVGIGKFDGLETARRVVEFDYGKVGGGVGADELSGIDVAVSKRHLNLLSPGNHVVIGDDVALSINDCTGSLGSAVGHCGLNGDHRAGDAASNCLPIGGFASLGSGRAGAGLV